jgi:hypothetical protein
MERSLYHKCATSSEQRPHSGAGIRVLRRCSSPAHCKSPGCPTPSHRRYELSGLTPAAHDKSRQHRFKTLPRLALVRAVIPESAAKRAPTVLGKLVPRRVYWLGRFRLWCCLVDRPQRHRVQTEHVARRLDSINCALTGRQITKNREPTSSSTSSASLK